LKRSLHCLFLSVVWGVATCACVPATAADDDGHQPVTLDAASLRAGARIDLTGRWLYKPGYAVAAGETPQSPGSPGDAPPAGYLSVPVPQILNRIHWWLDDSADFGRWEDERLKRLGFDTERAEDGWYRRWVELPEPLPAGARVFVEFDGVAMRSKTFLNGQPLGEHAGMFSRFAYDLTPHLRPGRNLLAVFVSMEKIPASTVDRRPRRGGDGQPHRLEGPLDEQGDVRPARPGVRQPRV
jgi:hypothetical protein